MGTFTSLSQIAAAAIVAINLGGSPANAQIAIGTPSAEDVLKQNIIKNTIALIALKFNAIEQEIKYDYTRTPHSENLRELQEILNIEPTDGILGPTSAKAIIESASQALELSPLDDPILTLKDHPTLIRKLEVLAPNEINAYLEKLQSPTRRALVDKTTEVNEQLKIITSAAEECVGGKIDDPDAFIKDVTNGINDIKDPVAILNSTRQALRTHCGKYLSPLTELEQNRIIEGAVTRIGPSIGEFIHKELTRRDLERIYRELFRDNRRRTPFTPRHRDASLGDGPLSGTRPA